MIGNSFTVLALAWGQEYWAAAEVLRASCKPFNLPCEVLQIHGWPKSPQTAWARRPAMILHALEVTRKPVLMVDADALVRRDPRPHLAEAFAYDLAAYEHSPGIWYAGTIFINSTERARRVVEAWRDRMNEDRHGWTMDSIEFGHAVRAIGPRILALPPEMCWVPQTMRQYHGLRQPVIEQLSIGSRS